MCPVCTVAVAGGLGLSRFLGIDDVISGFWVGALILSTSFWFLRWLKTKFKKVSLDIPIILLMYLLVLYPLAKLNIINHPLNKIFGVDKLIFGTILGSIFFLLGIWTDKKIRKLKGRQLVLYQKVVIPVLFLLVPSIISYFLLK
jgi:hypothetical protein